MKQFVFGIAALVSGCVFRPPVQANVDSLRARASFDLRCPDSQLVVTEIDGMTAGVDGCGMRATYVYTSTGTWVLNSPGMDSGQGQPATSPPPPAAPPPPPVAPPPPPSGPPGPR